MSTTAGYFDETILNNIRVKAENIMFDDRIKQQFDARYDVIKLINNIQTANVYPSLARFQKKVAVDVMWQNVCGQDVEDNVNCTVGGDKSSTNLDTYTLSYEKVVNFSSSENDFDDNEFDIQTAIAKQFLKADKNLTEDFAQYAVGIIDANAGWNTTSPEGKGDIVGADTYIAPAYWNASLAAYFSRVAILNKFTSPVILSGTNLYEQMYVAAANNANANGKGDYILYGDMNLYFDLFNVDTVTTPNQNSYLISQGALAMANRALHTDRVEVLHDWSRWRMPSRYLPNMYYDVFYETDCEYDRVIHKFKVKLVADVFVNPTGCDDNNTGILSFTCGVDPS